MYGKLARGEKTKSLTTEDLINLYLQREERKISPIPKTGITRSSFQRKRTYLNVWKRYIDEELKMSKTPIEKIPSDTTRDFGYWIQRQEKRSSHQKTGYSSDYINSVSSEVLKMYRDVGIRDRYISQSHIPEIDFLKAQPSNQAKRDIFSVDEYLNFAKHLRTNKYLKPENSTLEEQGKRSMFREFIGISYNTGMRPSELLKLKWGDISINITDSKDDQKIFRIIKVRSENSKTGRMRSVNGPVGRRFERLKNTFEKLGFECNPETYIFRNIHPRMKGENVPYKKSMFSKRLVDLLKESGIKEEMDKRGKHITLYSSRHFYTTMRHQNGLDIHLLAKQLGTSTTYIDRTYSHIQVETNTERITKRMILLKTLEEE